MPKTTPFDIADYLRDERDIAEFLDEALKEKDLKLFENAVNVVARTRNRLQKEVSPTTKENAKNLKKEQNSLTFKTLYNFLEGLGLRLSVIQQEN
jgi:probable addiction module antidote protein